MRHENYKCSPYWHIYDCIAAWCNQPSIFKTFTFADFCKCRGMKPEGYKKYKRNFEEYLAEYKIKYSSWKYFEQFMEDTNNIFNKEAQILPKELSEYGMWVIK